MNLTGLKKHIADSNNMGTDYFLNKLKDKISRNELDMFAILSWHTWFCRNCTLHRGVIPLNYDLVEWCYNFINDFRNLKTNVSKR